MNECDLASNMAADRSSVIDTWPLCRCRVGSDVFFDAFRAKSFPLTQQQALVHHPCKLVGLRLAAVKQNTDGTQTFRTEQESSEASLAAWLCVRQLPERPTHM